MVPATYVYIYIYIFGAPPTRPAGLGSRARWPGPGWVAGQGRVAGWPGGRVARLSRAGGAGWPARAEWQDQSAGLGWLGWWPGRLGQLAGLRLLSQAR